MQNRKREAKYHVKTSVLDFGLNSLLDLYSIRALHLSVYSSWWSLNHQLES